VPEIPKQPISFVEEIEISNPSEMHSQSSRYISVGNVGFGWNVLPESDSFRVEISTTPYFFSLNFKFLNSMKKGCMTKRSSKKILKEKSSSKEVQGNKIEKKGSGRSNKKVQGKNVQVKKFN